MRRALVLVTILAGVFAIVGSGLASARPYDTFILYTGDKIIAESPGCHASCVVTGSQRTCTVKSPDCRAACTELVECRPDGVRPIKVCAIVRENR